MTTTVPDLRRFPASQPSPPHSTRRLPELDGLRGLAVSLVLIWHYVVSCIPGDWRLLRTLLALTWSGVDLFFVLSGFLIGGILLDARESPRYFSTFFIRRAYRILPLYYTMLLLFGCSCLLVRRLPVLHPLVDFPEPFPWLMYLTFTQNLWMGHIGLGVNFLGATWSLCVEEQFYWTLPFLIRFTPRSVLPWILSILIAFAPAFRIYLYFHDPAGHFPGYVWLPGRFDALGLGVLAAVLLRAPSIWNALTPRVCRLLGLASLGLFCGLFPVAQACAQGDYYIASSVGQSLLALFYTSLLVLAVAAPQGPVGQCLRIPLLQSAGTLCYGLYLMHLPVEWFCYSALLGVAPGSGHGETAVACTIVAFMLTVALANLSWTYLEKPLLKRGHAHTY